LAHLATTRTGQPLRVDDRARRAGGRRRPQEGFEENPSRIDRSDRIPGCERGVRT
jgi:hypothetical protein